MSVLTAPFASHAPTPRSEPIVAERIPSVSEVATIFVKFEIFLARNFQGAIITVPTTFTDAQRTALGKAATDAGV